MANKSMMMDNGECTLTDVELHAEIQRLDPLYKEAGKLNDAQRQIKIKKLHHLQAKDRKEREAAEKKEKEAEKKEKEAQKLAAKNAPQPEKKTRGGKRKSTMPVSALPVTPEKREAPGKIETLVVLPEKAQASPKKMSATEVVTNCLTLTVTDSSRGRPASDLQLTLYGFDTTHEWKVLAQRKTNADGECPGLITRDLFLRGLYRLHFDTLEYFKKSGATSFYPYVEVVFSVEDPNQRHHQTIVLGPHGYSTYRSS